MEYEQGPQPETAAAAVERLGLTVESTFVPWSQSRSFKPDAKPAEPGAHSLNWKVTVRHNGRDVLTCDYTAGIGHAPAYRRATESKPFGRGLTAGEWAMVEHEIETGRAAYLNKSAGGAFSTRDEIKPDALDVLYSLASDSDVLEYPDFEEWAESLGYSTDSRKAESTYRECLAHTLKLRAALGDDGLAALREAFQDY